METNFAHLAVGNGLPEHFSQQRVGNYKLHAPYAPVAREALPVRFTR